MKYSDQIVDWLVELGYTHCFYVGGGNIMHLLDSCSRKMTCIATVHEVAAGVAVEYFNAVGDGRRALALVTAGPGLTNLVTAVAGAWLESRELLVLGGQVKTPDLSRGEVRQRGIQEIDGVSIVKSITAHASTIEEVLDQRAFVERAQAGSHGRRGPVFLELPLDIQGREVDPAALRGLVQAPPPAPEIKSADIDALATKVRQSQRPLFLLGGGVDHHAGQRLGGALEAAGIPVATTWNGADRIGRDHPMYVGRANTWGQRSANLIVQQSDLLVALGTRLGYQQSGFNWQEFVPTGEVVHVDIDDRELTKGHPRTAWPIYADANALLEALLERDLGAHGGWLTYCRQVRRDVPLLEANTTGPGFLSPYVVATTLGALSTPDDIIIPCSSGGAFTVMMQAFEMQSGQRMVTNKGLASMGYGLSGAIGAAIASGRRTILVEGDGGFSQNLQEIGTAAVNDLDLKIFIFDDNGYASIRSVQVNYFQGRYVGCDRATGLGLPDWSRLFDVWDVPCMTLADGFESDPAFLDRFNDRGVQAFIVPVDPQQTYFPRITSRMVEGGGMVSNPLHRMTPPLPDETLARIGAYLPA
ncbi:thiamine pyrophosphate-binding protein [Brevundimonas sp.]|uniref:thiamine pyrophosphate-binding protein n=1 Tax=Brevundimonas sp. TaxID=1871086 RepID=UPI0027317C9D|nr:thiamine pyrophosphate-binding protein [Brevundimonas sp.]MDP1912753.1 thiamine pyrophosphate-binding protein [Brevundimonas sp.]